MAMYEEKKREKKKELQAGGPRAWASLPYTLKVLGKQPQGSMIPIQKGNSTIRISEISGNWKRTLMFGAKL